MEERKKDEKTGVWTDLLIVLILSNFVLQNIQQWPLVPFLLVVFALFASLRSRLIGKWMQRASAIAASVVFLRDVLLFQGKEEFSRALILLVLLTVLYLLLRRFRRFFLR